MAEEHLRQLIYTYATKGKIEPWEYQEILAVAQRHNVSPTRVQVLITEVVNNIDFQNLPKQTPKPEPENVISPFLKKEEAGSKTDNHILQPFHKPEATSNSGKTTTTAGQDSGWVRSNKKQLNQQAVPTTEPEAEKKSNTFKIVLLVILIVLALYILLGWVSPARQVENTKVAVNHSEEKVNPEELEKFYNGLYFSSHKQTKTLLVLQLLQVNKEEGRAMARFQLNGESYRERASIDFENQTIRIPKLGVASFYKSENTIVIESEGSVNQWKLK